MIYADTDDATHVPATKGASGHCPTCAQPVIAKCGPIVSWHWAHTANNGADCDTWSEAVGAWHLAWQSLAPAACREVVMRPHRADLRCPDDGTVVELQASSIPVADIRAREAFYGRMLWIFDAREAYIDERLDIRPHSNGHVTFRWKHPRKSVAACTQPVFLDIGGGRLIEVRKMHPDTPCGGWGYLRVAAGMQSWIQSWTPALFAVGVSA